MPQPVYILFGAVFTCLTAVAAGKLLFHLLCLRLRKWEETLLAFYAGAACLSLAVFALSAAGLAYKGVFLALGLLVISLVVTRGAWHDRGEPLAPLPRLWKWFFGLLFALFFLVYFTNAMTPERSPDGAAYHLGLVARYLREHGFRRLTTNMYANLSQGVEMLFLFAFAFGRHSAAALVHFAFLATLPLAMLAWARREGFSTAGATGALLIFLSPVFGKDGTCAYIDVAVAGILFALFYLLQIWERERTAALLVPVGLLAGFAYAAKYTAFLALPFALGFVGWRLWRERKPLIKPLLIVSACAALLILPWMVKNWLWVDNPFSPFFNRYFPNPYVHVSLEQEWMSFLRRYDGLKSHWEIPLEVTVRGRVLCGLLGPVFLLAPLGLLALREKAGRRLLAAALLFGSVYPLNIGTRFLIPAAPFLALAMGLTLSRARGMAPLLVAAHAFASWPSNIPLYADQYAWRLEMRLPWKAAFRLIPEEGFLIWYMPDYVVARYLETEVPPGERVLVLTQVAESYTNREVLVGYQAAFNETSADILLTPATEDWHPRKHFYFRFPKQKLSAVRVVQTAEASDEHWVIHEVHLFSGGRPVPFEPGWRRRSKPNPWELDLAFDGNPATRWRSWQNLYPGMYLEVGFPAPVELDAVRLDCPLGFGKARMRLEGLTTPGTWESLVAEPELEIVPSPPGLRRAAVQALLDRGIGWLLWRDFDFCSQDLREHTAEWGISYVGERNGARLYRLSAAAGASSATVAPQPPASGGASR